MFAELFGAEIQYKTNCPLEGFNAEIVEDYNTKCCYIRFLVTSNCILLLRIDQELEAMKVYL